MKVLIMVLLLLVAVPAYAGEKYISVGNYFGVGSCKDYRYWQESLYIRGTHYVLFKGFNLGTEADFSKYNWEGGTRVAITAMAGYDYAKYLNMTFYIEGGGGIAATSGVDNIQFRNLVYSGIAGVMKAGTGIRFPLSKKTDLVLGYRWDHLSALKRGDVGVNNQGIKLELQWRLK